MRAVALLSLLILALALPFVGLGAAIAGTLGFALVVLVLGFVAPRHARIVGASGLVLAGALALLAPEPIECDAPPPPDGVYVPLVYEATRVLSPPPCANAAADARRARRRHAVCALVTGALGLAGAGAMLLARPRRRRHARPAVDPGFST